MGYGAALKRLKALFMSTSYGGIFYPKGKT